MVDPRIAKRRNDIHQESAHTSVRRLMKWVLIAIGIFGAGWFSQSSSFQVHELIVEGVVSSDASQILEREGVTLNQPLMRLRPSAAEEALLRDPWIREATVEVSFPNTVRVAVRERRGVGWVLVGDRSIRVAADGFALETGNGVGSFPTISLEGVPVTVVGAAFSDARVIGVAEFLAGLPDAVTAQSVVTEQAGELWLELLTLDLKVRLGRPVDMERKAAALVGLLNQRIEAGSIVHLIAPERPAIESPSTEEGS